MLLPGGIWPRPLLIPIWGKVSTTLANPVEMIANGAPRIIRNDEELAD